LLPFFWHCQSNLVFLAGTSSSVASQSEWHFILDKQAERLSDNFDSSEVTSTTLLLATYSKT